MKKFCLLMLLQVAMCTLFAQNNKVKHERRHLQLNPMKDNKDYKGYAIKLIPTLPGQYNLSSYGFIILENNKPVASQLKNPIPSAALGIQNKADAYTIAQWMVREHKKMGCGKI